jgi:hypothetical protein
MHPTETPSKDDRKRIAHERLAARARRIAMLRRRVAAGALATFVLAWGVVSQTGSLGATTTAATSVTAATTVTARDDSNSTSSAIAPDTSSPSTPVTTSQS